MSDQSDNAQLREQLRHKINRETAVYAWAELLKHFAGGHVIAVAAGLDLVEVALHMANDDSVQIQQWLANGEIAKVSDLQAQAWLDADASLWTVVVKPWVLVQHKMGLH